MEQYVVTTSLSVDPVVKNTIGTIVRLRCIVEAYVNFIFTHLLLKYFSLGIEFTPVVVSQACVSVMYAALCSRTQR